MRWNSPLVCRIMQHHWYTFRDGTVQECRRRHGCGQWRETATVPTRADATATVRPAEPASTGPMQGQWDPTLMAALQDLKHATNRELDRAQVGAPIPTPDPFLAAAHEAIRLRAT